MGVEPTCQPWEGRILPMNYTRMNCPYYSRPCCKFQVLFVEGFLKGQKDERSAPFALLPSPEEAGKRGICVREENRPDFQKNPQTGDCEEKHLCFYGLQMN